MYQQKCKGPFRLTTSMTLASASPRRLELLSSLGIDFRVVHSNVDEPPAVPGEKPEDYALNNARLKAFDVYSRYCNDVVLGADTVVVVDDTILGKPSGVEEAIDMLSLLCGRMHRVLTACHILMPEQTEKPADIISESRVWLSDLHKTVVEGYVETGESLDKAGSYAVQGVGAFMVERIEGSYTNVVGLPLSDIVAFLLSKNILQAGV